MQALLSHSHIDKRQAEAVQRCIARESDIIVTLDAIDFRPSTSSTSFMDSVRDHDAVIHLISRHLIESRHCMRELLTLINEPSERQHYRDHAVPIIVEDDRLIIPRAGADNQLTRTTGENQLVEYWRNHASHLEDDLDNATKSGTQMIDELRGELVIVRDIAAQISRFMRFVTEDIAYAVSYAEQTDLEFSGVLAHLRTIASVAAPPSAGHSRLGRKIRERVRGTAPQPSFDEQRLRNVCDSIRVPSENDPAHPEFPPFSPRFPATPTHKVHIDRLGRDILVKDESYNFTGSHKDRMAWEIVVFYKQLLEDRLESAQADKLVIPPASIISNGSAALAIQVLFRCFGLPALKVLIDDDTTSEPTRQKLERAGCEVYARDLSARELDSTDVLEMTDNPDGYDFTSRNIVDPHRRTYYDWLAYEILNAGAKHVFIPVGTGDLYVNVLTVLRDELTGASSDSRLEGGSQKLVDREIYGATSVDWKTKMDKLYATHRPTLVEARRFVSEMRERGHCGAQSEIHEVGETPVADALEIARTHRIQTEPSGIAGLGLLLELSDKNLIPPDEEILVVNTGRLALP